MSAPVSTALNWQWPPDVLEFADQQRVRGCLEPLLDATRMLFPTAHRLRVLVDEDPENSDDRHIVFDVQVLALDVPQPLQTQHRWNDELYRCCPPYRTTIFRLCLDMIPA
jgi:hypothetical protein